MVDEASYATLLRSVDNSAFVNSEEIAASNTALRVCDFTQICDLLSNLFADILNDHFAGRNAF